MASLQKYNYFNFVWSLLIIRLIFDFSVLCLILWKVLFLFDIRWPVLLQCKEQCKAKEGHIILNILEEYWFFVKCGRSDKEMNHLTQFTTLLI